MTILSGFDSAFGPTLPVAQQARTAGITWWAGYLGGPGAFHQWTPAEWAVLRQAGLTPACLWVPTDALSESPTQAARDAVGAASSLGLFGAVMLDTEEEMRTSPLLRSFVDAFYAEVVALGRPCPVYDGAGYTPPGAPVFNVAWGSTVYPGPGAAVQYGPATRFGMAVDVDLADPAFPLGSWTPPAPVPGPPPPVTPVVIASWSDPEEGPMTLQTVTVGVGNGYGWVQTTIPWADFAAATVQGLDPQATADGHYLDARAQVQDRNNCVFVTVSGAVTVPEVVTPTTVPAVYTGSVTVYLETHT